MDQKNKADNYLKDRPDNPIDNPADNHLKDRPDNPVDNPADNPAKLRFNRLVPGKKMDVFWYVKLNIMVMSFLFVLFLIKQSNTPAFKAGLSNIFKVKNLPQQDRSIKIQKPDLKKTREKIRDRQVID